MTKRLNLAGTILAAFTMLVTVVMLSATPALAHHKAEHDNGSTADDASSAKDNDGDAGNEDTTYTEDSDDDGAVDKANDADTTASSHPSGKDRYIESGGSANQGGSESNPDDSKGPMRYEGAPGDDKPNGPGGTDVFDQDGNNGCGNDQDFDDDNNGHCGRPTDTDTVLPTVETTDDDTVLPKLDTRPARPADEVLGAKEFAAPKTTPEVTVAAARPATQGAVLPFTGVNVIVLLAVGLGLIGAGTVTVAKVR